MRTAVPLYDWLRWSVTALGVFFCGVIVSAVIVTGIEWTMIHHLRFAISIFLAVGLAAYGGWLVQSELSTERILRITTWSLAGVIIIGSFATWEMYLHLVGGGSFISALQELILGATQGAIVGGGIGYYDAKRLEQHQERKQAYQAISASIDGVALLDEDGLYSNLNQAHADVYGYDDTEDFLGKSWRICYSEEEIATIEETVLPTLEEEGEWRGELTGQRRDGTLFPQEVTLSSRDDGGIVCVVRDISERKQRERELERHRDLFEQTQRMAHIGGWELDLVDDELQWTDEVYRIHELPLDYEPTVDEALDYYHPEDAPAIEAAIERAIKHGEDYDLELRLITANDNLRWVRARGEARTAGDETVMLRGTFQDITERKERDQEFHSTSTLLSTLVENIPAGILAEDSARQILYTNQAFTEMFGIETAPDDLVGCDCEVPFERIKDLFVESERFIESTNEAAANAASIDREEFELVDGRTFERSGIPVQLEDEGAGYLWVYHNTTERKRRVQALEEAEGRFRALTDNAEFGVLTIDETSTIQYANDALEEVLGYRPEELEGESITNLMPERFQADHHAGIQNYLREGTRNLDWDWLELPGLHRDGHEVPLGISFGVTQLEDGPLFIGILRDITAQVEQEDRIAALHEGSRQLMYAMTPKGAASMTVEIARQVLDKPLSAMWFYDEETDRLEPVTATDSSREFLDAAGIPELPPLGADHVAMDVFRDGELAVIEDYNSSGETTYLNLPLGTVLFVPIGDHGVLVLGTKSVVEITETDRDQINILALNARAALDRAQREQMLTRRQEMIESLHTATRDMVAMKDTEQVCKTAVDAAEELLDFSITGIWLSDDTGRRLEPVATSEEGERVIGELPVYSAAKESLSWQAFESGETRVYDDLQTEAGLANTETPIQSEIIVPLGDAGIMNIGSLTAHSFDETDVHTAELLGANTATALERVERERELEIQMDRMEFFNSILRHDVLNGMTVIRGRAELLVDELDGAQLRDAETILDWSDDTIEIVQRVRKILDTLTGEADIPVESVGLSTTLREELERVRDTYPDVTFETMIPDSITVQANELLGDVLGNVITNAMCHNETDGLCVSLTATEQEVDDTATVRIADNGRGIPDESKESIFRRDATGHAKSSGTGFGLFFVDTMINQYGGDIWVEDNEAGGATFVVELPLAKATATV